MANKTTTISVLIGCARCNGNHEDLKATKFTNHTDLYDLDGDGPYNFWTMCPTVNEPLLVYKPESAER